MTELEIEILKIKAEIFDLATTRGLMEQNYNNQIKSINSSIDSLHAKLQELLVNQKKEAASEDVRTNQEARKNIDELFDKLQEKGEETNG